MRDIIEKLRDFYYRGPMQPLRSFRELDRFHDAAADEIERLRKALTKIANTGQSEQPDHWKFRVMARMADGEALKGGA